MPLQGDFTDYEVKDSGEHVEHESGMLKDASSLRKPRFTLIDLLFLTRLASHMTKGAEKYGANNWRLGNTFSEMGELQDSAFRHLVAWLEGKTDEDHAAAVCANIMMAEGVKQNIGKPADYMEGLHIA